MNGHRYSGQGGGPDPRRRRDDSRDETPSGEGIPHLQDLVSAAGRKVDELQRQPLSHLLEEAEHSLNAAKILSESRKGPAKAYLQYLIACELVVRVIPSSRDFVDRIQASRSNLYRRYRNLQHEIAAYDMQFQNIKSIIVHDNNRNGTQRRYYDDSSRNSSMTSSQNTLSSASYEPRYSSDSGARYRDDELMLPDAPSQHPSRTAYATRPSESPRRKPPVHSKPDGLHGTAIHHGANGSLATDDLVERFQKLRGASAPLEPSGPSSYSVSMPSPTDFHSSGRPMGPRDPPPPSYPPPHPPKLPLQTEFAASLPKPPSPTYSPARNLSTPASINPPRSTARSMVGTGGRRNSQAASSYSSQAPHTNGNSDSYFPPTKERLAGKKHSVSEEIGLQIRATILYDWIRMYNVLIIDVRSREEFDSGHIPVSSIMCIEPTALQDGYSAEQLQERLVLSPDEEQDMFERRDEYDLVVYYDQSTRTNSFLDKHSRNEREMALKRLFDTLYQFNVDKPLRHPPAFLMGGLDEWVALVGPGALRTSNTATSGRRSRPSTAIARLPRPSNTPRLNLQKRRIREYAPLDPDEEQKFLEEARQGRAVFEQPDEEDEDEPSSPIYRSTEEFLRRYPDVVDMERESMIYPPQRPSVPSYPTPPPAASVPSAPSRPPPSVARVSYGGVHERELAPHGRTTQTPVYVSPSRYGQLRLPKTGLFNFGATCYMNSVIQCLSGTIELSNIFLHGRFVRDIQRDNWKGTHGLMPEAYATLLSNLWKGDISAIRPSSFRRLCARLNSQWGTDQQQDAKEFLEFVLDLLHEDLNVTWSKPPLRQLSAADEQIRERLPRPYAARVEWGRYTHREKSVIGDLFAGQHASRLQCTTCRTTSTTYEAFWSLSVEIPHDRPTDLRDCLRSYCSEEKLVGDDIWRCPRCKAEREATKKITITRAPDFLVIHLKRFSASHTEGAKKVRTPVEFPLHGLDLGPFMEPPMTPAQEDYVVSQARDGSAQLAGLRTDPAMNGPYIYNAYAVVRHIGASLGSGHYVAVVKDKARGSWRQFNDTNITDFQPGNLPPDERLQNEKAYIVFYERERVAGGVF